MALPPVSPSSTCLVTGASSGIGAEIARELARRGHGVTLVARRKEKLATLAKELSGAHAVRAEVLVADLTDAASRAALAPAITELGLAVEVLVNNAGFTTVGAVSRADRAKELALVATNVDAVVDLCTIFTGPMVDRGRGAVLNTASTAAYQPLPGQAAYGASKAFVLSYSHALRTELRHQGVSVTALCPGPVKTGFGEAAGLTEEETETLPQIMWVAADEVARAGVEGLEHNRAVVIPGAANKVGAAAGYFSPRGPLLSFMASRHPGLKN
jgi:uncharacterized protein